MAGVIFKSFPVSGVEPDGDGLKVVGKCSDGDVDFDGDVVSPAWMKQAVDDFLRGYPAIRLQHRSDYPVGKGLRAWQDASGATFLESLIVDDKAVRLVKSQVLRAYSVGIAEPKTRPHPKASRYEIYGGRLVEVSVCDSPSNARCSIEVCKSVGGVPVFTGKVRKPPKLEKAARKALAAEEAYALACLRMSDPALRQRAEQYLAGRRG